MRIGGGFSKSEWENKLKWLGKSGKRFKSKRNLSLKGWAANWESIWWSFKRTFSSTGMVFNTYKT